MTHKSRSTVRLTLAALVLISTSGAKANQDRPPSGLSSSKQLTQDKSGGESWTYSKPPSVFTKYRTVIVDPTVVYSGPDSQFRNVDVADRTKFASILTAELRSEIGKSFLAPAKPQADTLRIHTTLLGAEKTETGFATASRVSVLGFASSAVKSVMGKGGSFTGSILYAVEVYDARSGELLLAAIRRRTPDPLDVPATLSTTNTVKAVARDFANSARRRLEELTQYRKN